MKNSWLPETPGGQLIQEIKVIKNMDYPRYLNPFGDEDYKDVRLHINVTFPTADYPESLNPFADDGWLKIPLRKTKKLRPSLYPWRPFGPLMPDYPDELNPFNKTDYPENLNPFTETDLSPSDVEEMKKVKIGNGKKLLKFMRNRILKVFKS